MSRIGRKNILISDKVDVQYENNIVTVKGPKGELSLELHPKVSIEIKDKYVAVIKKTNDKLSRSLYGLTQRLISNMVSGVVEGFEKKLEVKGVGYRTELKGKNLVLHVGYSHPVEITIPEGLEVKVQKNIISVSGIDKQKVGQFAANIRQVRKPEPYKGKGIRYQDEIVRRKSGKTAKTATAGA